MKKMLTKKVSRVEERAQVIVNNEALNKSAKMKALFDLGLEVKAISVMLGVRYNFVYNVISNYVLINGIEVDNSSRGSKKEKVIELLEAGKSVKEICVELQCNMNYVYKIKKGLTDGAGQDVESEAK